jgi:hypothetical protein
LTIIDNNDYVGLFGMISETGRVENLALADANIAGNARTGALCGVNMGTVGRCGVSSAKVIGDANSIGGLCGVSNGTVQNCYAKGVVLGGSAKAMGGLCGTNYNGIILQSYTEEITAASDANSVGGLAGANYGGTIQDCYAENINAIGNIGCGGFCGISFQDGKIKCCYSTQVVLAGSSAVGSFCGFKGDDIIFDNCFWDTQTSNVADGVGNLDPDPDDVRGRTTAQMQTQSTFTEFEDNNWDFDKPVWMIFGQDYPKLIWNTPDIDDDNDVDFTDFAKVAELWMAEDCGFCNGADLTGDRNVNAYDLNIIAANWLKEESISEHIHEIEICYGLDYESPDSSTDTNYEFEFGIGTDNNVERIEFLTPAGNTYEITETFNEWEDETGWFDVGRELDEIGNYWWYYEAEFFDDSSLNNFGAGEYTITVYYNNGRSQQTTANFTIPGTNEPIPQTTQIPIITSFANGATLTSPITVNWQACTDPAANTIWFSIETIVNDEEVFERECNISATGLEEPVELQVDNYECWLGYEVWYNIQNNDGIPISIGKYNESDYEFTIE